MTKNTYFKKKKLVKRQDYKNNLHWGYFATDALHSGKNGWQRLMCDLRKSIMIFNQGIYAHIKDLGPT